MRSVEFRADAAGRNRIFLNHKPQFLIGPLDQGWWPDGLYTAPTDEALRSDIEALKKLGFNMARKHVKVEPDRWYYWCDKLGLMVWQDMPSGDRFIGSNDPDIERSADSEANFRREWQAIIDVTLNGTFRCTRAALRRMVPSGAGVIVNNASVLGWRAQVGQAHYAAAKAGVMALTRCAALEAAPAGVRVNAVSPSLAMHPFLSKAIDQDTLDELVTREAFGRSAEPWEVANVIVFLASDYSSYMTGEVVSVSSQHP